MQIIDGRPRLYRFLRWLALLLLPVSLLTVSIGCNKSGGGQAAAPPPQVDVAYPKVMEMRRHEEFTGRTQSPNSVVIQARVDGYLDIVCVGRKEGEIGKDGADANPQKGMKLIKEGGDVQKGDILFVIEQKPYEIAVAQAQKTLEQNIVQRDFNKRNYDRNAKAGAGVSPSDLDTAYAAWQTSQAQVGQAEQALRTAQQNLDWATVRAPFNGRIGKRMVDRGNNIKANTTNLCTIEQIDPLYAFFDVDERTLMSMGLRNGQVPLSPQVEQEFPLELALASDKADHFTHKGTLQISDNRVDPSTGTLRMWGLFDNPDGDLKSGMFVRVRIGIGKPKPQQLFVDERALNSDQGRKFLYVVVSEEKDGKTISRIDRRDVNVGQRKNGMIAVDPMKPDAPNALTAKDRVVVSGLQTIRKGAEVEPKEVPMPGMTTTTNTGNEPRTK